MRPARKGVALRAPSGPPLAARVRAPIHHRPGASTRPAPVSSCKSRRLVCQARPVCVAPAVPLAKKQSGARAFRQTAQSAIVLGNRQARPPLGAGPVLRVRRRRRAAVLLAGPLEAPPD